MGKTYLKGEGRVRETYLAIKKKVQREHPDWKFIAVTRTAKSVLAPSQKLLGDWKNGKIDWDGYRERYYREINSNPMARDELVRIADMILGGDTVCLVCYEKPPTECHRFIVMEMIDQILDEKRIRILEERGLI